jgi:hypothetical protein
LQEPQVEQPQAQPSPRYPQLLAYPSLCPRLSFSQAQHQPEASALALASELLPWELEEAQAAAL